MSEKKEYINFCETKTKYDLDKNSLLERQLLITNLDDLDTYSTIITTRIFDFLISLVPEENPPQNLSEKYYKINFIKFSKDDNYNVFSSEDDAMASNFEFSFTDEAGIKKEFDSDEPRIYNTDIITKIEVSPDFISSYDKSMMDVSTATDNLSPISIYNYNYEESLQEVQGNEIYDRLHRPNSTDKTDKIEELFESIQKNQTNVNSKINSILEGNHAIINNIFSRFLGYPDMDFIAMYNNYQEIREREAPKSAQKGGAAVAEAEKTAKEKTAEELEAAGEAAAVVAAAAKTAAETEAEKETAAEELKAAETAETEEAKEKEKKAVAKEKTAEAPDTEKKNKITIKLNGRGGKVRLNNTPKYIRLTFQTFKKCKDLLSVKDSYKKKSIIYPFTYKYLESLFGKIYEKYKILKKTGKFKNETLILNRDKIKLFFEVIPMTIIDNKTIDYNIDYFSRNILQDDKLLFKVKKDLSKFKDEELFLNLMKNPFIFIERLKDSDFTGHKELYKAYDKGNISDDTKLEEYLEKVGGETYINLFSKLYGELLKKIKELIKNYTRKAEVLAKKINDKQDGTDDETKKLVDTLYTTTGIKTDDQEILTNLIKKREELKLDPFYKPDISNITINKDIRKELDAENKKKAQEKYFEDGVIGKLEVLKKKCNEINEEAKAAEAAAKAAEAAAAKAKDKAHKQMLVLKHVIDLITGENSQLINTLIKEKQFIEERYRQLVEQFEGKEKGLESRKEGLKVREEGLKAGEAELKDKEAKLKKLSAEAQERFELKSEEVQRFNELHDSLEQKLAKELEALEALEALRQQAIEREALKEKEAQEAQKQAQTPQPISTLFEIANNKNMKESLTTGLKELNKVVKILTSDSSGSPDEEVSSTTIATTANWYDSIREILENVEYNGLAELLKIKD